VENDCRGIKPLQKTNATFKAQPISLRPCRDPCESEVGNEVVVVVESADIAMAAREEHFDDLAFVSIERDILKELPRLITRNGVTCPFHILRTIRRDIEPYGRINSVPKTEIGNCHAKLVEPRRKVPRNKRTAREAKEKYFRCNAILRQSLVIRLKPPPRGAECRPPVNARNPPRKI